jgi:hypothetical protein
MGGKLIAGILSLCLAFTAPMALAAPKTDKAAQTSAQGPRRHLTTIVMAGLAGAILGLSTLSFYGRPQDRLSNIATGFAIGIVIGACYTTYKAAAEPKEFYSVRDRDATAQLWTVASDMSNRPPAQSTPTAKFVFRF